jgi:hypothetical protein
MQETTFVTAYTPGAYKIMADRLLRSMRRWALPHDELQLQPQGSWARNTNLKPDAMIAMVEKHGGRIVWLDADAEVIRYPELFGLIDADVALHIHTRRNGQTELLSGTLMVQDTPSGHQLLERWRELSLEHPGDWDQWNLARAIQSFRKVEILGVRDNLGRVFLPRPSKAMGRPDLKSLKLWTLPKEYCTIDRINCKDVAEPVIWHYQASRKHRGRR